MLLNFSIDGIQHNIKKEETYTIFQFCFENKIFLPCFCYHEKLTIAGNCRICLVQVNDALAVSCAMLFLITW